MRRTLIPRPTIQLRRMSFGKPICPNCGMRDGVSLYQQVQDWRGNLRRVWTCYRCGHGWTEYA